MDRYLNQGKYGKEDEDEIQTEVHEQQDYAKDDERSLEQEIADDQDAEG